MNHASIAGQLPGPTEPDRAPSDGDPGALRERAGYRPCVRRNGVAIWRASYLCIGKGARLRAIEEAAAAKA